MSPLYYLKWQQCLLYQFVKKFYCKLWITVKYWGIFYEFFLRLSLICQMKLYILYGNFNLYYINQFICWFITLKNYYFFYSDILFRNMRYFKYRFYMCNYYKNLSPILKTIPIKIHIFIVYFNTHVSRLLESTFNYCSYYILCNVLHDRVAVTKR